MLLTRFLICVSLLVVMGCGPKTPIQRHPPNPATGDPGSLTALDADSYDALIGTHDAIEQTKTAIANGGFGTNAAQAKTALNITIDAYNIADREYKAYHADQSAANAAKLQDAVGNMQAAKVQLVAVKKGNTP